MGAGDVDEPDDESELPSTGEGGIESRALQLAGRRERLAHRGELSAAWLAGYA